MTKLGIRDLEKRVSDLSGPEENRAMTERDLYDRAIQSLTEEEQEAVCDVIIAAEKEQVNLEDELWLSKRPQDQQAVVRKVLARLTELRQEAKTS